MTIEWKISTGPVEYQAAVAFMEHRVAAIRDEQADECVWLLEHPPLYTAGTSADPQDLLWPDRFPVHQSGRGGEYTYHGPGQRVGYVMLDLKKRGPDIRQLVRGLEEWIIRTLAQFDIQGERREGRVGVWVVLSDGSECKIAAQGIRIRRWVCFHGISINLNPDLNHFGGIVPCGIQEHGVTSMHDLGVDVSMSELDSVLMTQFQAVFDS